MKQQKLPIQDKNQTNKIQQLNEKSVKDLGLNKLLQSISQSYEQNRLSLKFKDSQTEQDYVLAYHQNVQVFLMILTLQVIIFFTIYFGFSTYKFKRVDGAQNRYYQIVGGYIILIFENIAMCLLSRKYVSFSLYFTHMQSIIVYICMIEGVILANNNLVMVDGMIATFAVLSSLAFMSYNQVHLCIAYIFMFGYTLSRTYFWIDDGFRFYRFNAYFFVSLVMVYIYSRVNHQRDRQRFQQEKNEKQLLKLFHDLIKIYHDGIIITRGDEVVYKNKAIISVFDLNKKLNKKEQDQDDFANDSNLIDEVKYPQNESEAALDLTGSDLIALLQKTEPKFNNI
ncbi:UNKNOWN [Stylonychia lemnae]|uniref:Transmembrane protein n=1 Tax=Stylonychia lemnae TaxID=5949 RepID=A0A078B5N9_STYLE|nr:UNKNOWN [Stylonychia lemnae]|eukprot:CDW89729.1 UNKNOWN [Stylonychia lemnae]